MSRQFKDSMTPAERAKAIKAGQEVDRMPCNPNVANGVARVYGCKIGEFNTSARTLADAQIASYRRFGYDSVRVFTDLFPWCEAMGSEIRFPEDDTADLLVPAITSKDPDAYKLIHGFDPYKDGRMPVHLEAMKYLYEDVGDEVGVSAAIVGPFTNACFLMDIGTILRMTVKRPEVVHYLCQVSLESLIKYVDAAIDIGLGPTISEPMSSCTVVSPKVFREFSAPYLKKLVDHIHSRGKSVTMHICGQTAGIWNDIADMGCEAFSIDNVASISECKKTIGDRCKILGNVNPATTMFLGTPDEVKLATLKCIEEGYDSPKGFMPMSGCSLPVETPFENIDAMLDVCVQLGYPVKKGKLDMLIEEYEQKVAKVN